MAKVRLPPIGFWSYVRRDDERNRGKISELRELVLAELETQIGGDVPVFKDTISIPHGVRWEELTTQALSDATFFIPILTPAFLQSEWCCREVRLFLDRERELQAAYPDLPKRSRIFPIHYVEVGEDADTTDEYVRDTLMQLQHFPFQRKRWLHYHEPEVSDFITAFVTDIRDLLRARVEQAAPVPTPPPDPSPPAGRARPRKRHGAAGEPPAPPPPPPPGAVAQDLPSASPPTPRWIKEMTVYWIAGALITLLLILAIAQCTSRSPYPANNVAMNIDEVAVNDAASMDANTAMDSFENRADSVYESGNATGYYSDNSYAGNAAQ